MTLTAFYKVAKYAIFVLVILHSVQGNDSFSNIKQTRSQLIFYFFFAGIPHSLIPFLAQWSQAAGSSSVNGVGSYGNIGEYRAGNLPPSRSASVWFSYDFNNGQKFFWVFGGASRYTGSSSDQYLNDLWVYNGQFWAWLAGSKTTNAAGNFFEEHISLKCRKLRKFQVRHLYNNSWRADWVCRMDSFGEFKSCSLPFRWLWTRRSSQ